MFKLAELLTIAQCDRGSHVATITSMTKQTRENLKSAALRLADAYGQHAYVAAARQFNTILATGTAQHIAYAAARLAIVAGYDMLGTPDARVRATLQGTQPAQ